jgi:hypothetical protein
LDPAKEDPMGRSVSEEAKQELWKALGDSPIGATVACMSYLVIFPNVIPRFRLINWRIARRMASVFNQECLRTEEVSQIHKSYVVYKLCNVDKFTDPPDRLQTHCSYVCTPSV